jgi:integrase
MSIDKRRGRFVARWRDDQGRQRSKAFDKSGDARRFLAETETELARGTYVDQRAGRITLAAYAASWLKIQTSDAATRVNVEQHLRVHILPALGKMPLSGLRTSTVSAFLAELQRAGVGPSYIRTIKNTLSAVLNAAVSDRLIGLNPAATARGPRVTKTRVVPWEASQAAAVRAALPARYQALVDAGKGLGLRQGEIFGLAADDIDWLRPASRGGPVVHVRRQVKLLGGQLAFGSPKQQKERDVPLPASVAAALSAHLASFPDKPVTLPGPRGKPVTARLIFTSPRGGAVNRNTFNSYWRAAVAAAGMSAGRENGMHALRHHFASVLLAGGVDINAVSAYLGHTSPGFTLSVYCHLMRSAPDVMRSAIDSAAG